MSRWRAEAAGLGISAGSIVLAGGKDGPALAADLALSDFQGEGQLIDWGRAATAALSKATHKPVLQVTVSDLWARYWLVTPPQGLGSLEELKAFAGTRFESLFSEPTRDWAIEGDWQTSGNMLACAMPSALAGAVRSTASTLGWRLGSIVPWSIRLINRHAGEVGNHAWFCVHGARSVLVLLLIEGRIALVRQLRHEGELLMPDLLARLDVELLRSGLEAPPELFLAGDVPAGVAAQAPASLRVTVLGRGRAQPDIGRAVLYDADALSCVSEAWRLAVSGVKT